MVTALDPRVGDAARVVERVLEESRAERPLLWLALGIVCSATLITGVLALVGISGMVTVRLLFGSVTCALVAVWLDQREREARWTSWSGELRERAVPVLRGAVLEASPDQALELGRRVAEAVARYGPWIPEPPKAMGRKELQFLEGVDEPDGNARLLAWLAGEVCGGARDPERLVTCPFLRALQWAANERVAADG